MGILGSIKTDHPGTLINKGNRAIGIGFLVKAVKGGFDKAGVGDTPFGVTAAPSTPGQECLIQTSGEVQLRVKSQISNDESLRFMVAGDDTFAGYAAPIGDESTYILVGRTLESGKGLIRAILNIVQSASIGGTGIPAGGTTGEVLAKDSATDYDVSWQTPGAAGTVTSVTAGDGMDFTEINTTGEVTMGTPSTVTSTSTNGLSGVYHSHELDTSTLTFSVTVDGYAATPNTIPIGGALDFIGDTTYIQIQWNQTTQQLEFSYVGPEDFYAGWDIFVDDVDTGSRVTDEMAVNFLSGTYTTVTHNFLTPTLPWTRPHNDITVEVDYNQLSTDDIFYLQSEADALFATQSWVTNNFDNYDHWDVEVGGVGTDVIYSGDAVNFASGTNMTVTWGGPNTITFAMLTDFGYMDGWLLNADTDSARDVQNDAEVAILGGTGISTGEVTWSLTELRWEMTITNTTPSPWTDDTNGITYTAGNVGIGAASNATYDLTVEGTSWLKGNILTAGVLSIIGTNAVPLILERTDNVNASIQYTNNNSSLYAGIGSNDYFYVSTTNNLEVSALLTISDTGDVGIGDTSPGYKLDVDGTFRATGDSYFNSNIYQDDDDVHYFGSSSDGGIWHDGTNFIIRALQHGTIIAIQGEDTGGTNRNMIVCDPDSYSRLYYAGSNKIETTNTGVDVTGEVSATGEVTAYAT